MTCRKPVGGEEISAWQPAEAGVLKAKKAISKK